MASKQGLTSDQRFSRVAKDPRFWEMPEKDKKIKIDKRFRAMFHDKKFNLQYTVDKRGRPMNHNTRQDLKRYYDLSDSDEDVLPDTTLDTKKEKKKAKEKKKDEPKTKEAATKITKEKKEAETSEEINTSKAGKKAKAKGNNLQIDNEKATKTKGKLSTSAPPKGAKKAVKVMEQEEESEDESGLEDESDPDSNDEINSEEDMSGMDLEEDEESDGESEGDDSEEEGSEEEEEEDEEASSEEDEDSDQGPDLARGKGNIETSSEDEDDDDDELDLPGKQMEIEHSWREMDKDAPRGDEISRRLAVCNMDWDRLKAKDLLALFTSFKPKEGMVYSVKIYPSEYGKERLKEEELQGPRELKSFTEEVLEDKAFYKEKLREYQFNRLRYYYAVVECDSPETASKIYEDCDGLEFESSCSFVDLRFIPDDVQFDDEPKDSAIEVDLSAYQPRVFTSAAMVTSKVDLTWDETDQDRVTTLNRNFSKNEILDMDFQAYLASSSEEEEEEEEITPEAEVSAKPEEAKSKKGSKDDDEQIQRYRELLKGIQEKEKKQQEKDIEMEVKWVPGLKESAEQMVQSKLESKIKLTPWEKYLQKQKDKRKEKRKKKESDEESDDEDDMPSDVDLNDPFFSEELKKPGLQKKSGKKREEEESSGDEEKTEKQKAEMALIMMDDVEDDRKHFNYDKIVEQQNLSRSKKKRLKKKDELVEDDFQINVEDSRFQVMYTSHLYNVDPSDPNFKKTKAMDKVLEEKARRREKEQKNLTETIKRQQEKLEAGDKAETSGKKAVDPALSSLVKSIKTKTQQFQASKRQKTK